jgi:hypothetical protein
VKKLILLIVTLFSLSTSAQEVVLVHINAEFNASNDWSEIEEIAGARLMNGYIDKKPAIKEKYNIRYVPTLILFHNGQEVKRWEAGLDMKLHATKEEVQQEIARL